MRIGSAHESQKRLATARDKAMNVVPFHYCAVLEDHTIHWMRRCGAGLMGENVSEVVLPTLLILRTY